MIFESTNILKIHQSSNELQRCRDRPRRRAINRDLPQITANLSLNLLGCIPRYLLRRIHRYHHKLHRFWWNLDSRNIHMNLVYLYRFENRHHFDTRPRPTNITHLQSSPNQDDNGLSIQVQIDISRSRS